MAPDGRRPGLRSALFSFRFLLPAFVGSLAMGLVSALAPLPAQVAVLGCLLSIMAGLWLAYLEQEDERERRLREALESLSVPLALAPHHELFDQYRAIAKALVQLAQSGDPILRELAALKLASVAGQVEALASGTVVFSGTEAWRTVYETLLTSPDVRQYRSVAWVRTRDYWRDAPGRQSMDANFEAAHRGVLIERVVILRPDLWPRGAALPHDAVLPWIREQHNHGLWVTLVREADLSSEPELLRDMGIYGDRAVGVQELDEHSRTVRFTLTFDPQQVRLARDRWEKLSLYATSFRQILDGIERDG
jgi:hypothetical protein